MMEAIVDLWRRIATLWMLLVAKGVLSVEPTIPGAHHLHFALNHFDTLHKDHLQHKQVTHSFREVHFTTLDRNFQLHLMPRRRQLFHKNVQVHVIGKGGERSRHGIHFDHFYEGHLIDEPQSLVVAHLDHSSGLLTASITSQHDHYYIEPSHHHINVSHDFHMISYRASDLKYNLTRDPSVHFCGTASTTHHSLLSHDAFDDHRLHVHAQNDLDTPHYRQEFEKREHTHQQGRVAGKGVEVEREGEAKRRLKRQTSTGVVRDSCPMELVATHSFVREYGNEGVGDVVQYMIQLIDAIDQEIYRKTSWIGDSSDLGLSIKKITIFAEPSEAPIYNQSPPSDGWNSNTLLTHFSHANWSDVCLAHLFTSETFSDGRLGVAYIASPVEGLTGGICSQTLTNFNGAPLTTANVGISSLYDGRRLLLAEAQLITAHEIGHNWGSDHDPVTDNPCNPSPNNGGKFLMYQSVNDGNLANNVKFSVCSEASVEQVLTAKSSRCFENMVNVTSLCGNFAVEGEEECDGGFVGMFNDNSCCNTNCKLVEEADCSDVNDACCKNCQYANSTTVCKEYAPGNLQCLENITCSGTSKECPENAVSFVPIETSCRVDGKCYPPDSLCVSGTCTVDSSSDNSSLSCYNFCQLHNLTQCFCSGDDDCKTCCKSLDTLCEPFGSRDLPDGTTCDGGLCKSGQCELLTPDLVNRLYRLFTDISIDAIVRFMRENIVGSVLIFTVLVWVPACLLVHFCIDVKIWKKIVNLADEREKERLTMNEEDDLDYTYCDSIAQDYPEINPSKAKKGLQRMASRTESVYSYDSFPSPAYGSYPPVFDLESPMRPYHGHRLSIIAEEQNTADLDPSRDNILAYMSTSAPSSSSVLVEGTATAPPSALSTVNSIHSETTV